MCFTLDEVTGKLLEMKEHDEVTEFILQCGFNDVVQERKWASLVFDAPQQCVQVFRECYPDALILLEKSFPSQMISKVTGEFQPLTFWYKKHIHL